MLFSRVKHWLIFICLITLDQVVIMTQEENDYISIYVCYLNNLIQTYLPSKKNIINDDYLSLEQKNFVIMAIELANFQRTRSSIVLTIRNKINLNFIVKNMGNVH